MIFDIECERMIGESNDDPASSGLIALSAWDVLGLF